MYAATSNNALIKLLYSLKTNTEYIKTKTVSRKIKKMLKEKYQSLEVIFFFN